MVNQPNIEAHLYNNHKEHILNTKGIAVKFLQKNRQQGICIKSVLYIRVVLRKTHTYISLFSETYINIHSITF